MQVKANPNPWRGRALIAGGIGVLLIAFGIVGVIDFEEELRLEAARQERAVSLAASHCLPRPGQETRWTWKDADGTAVTPLRAQGQRPDPETIRLYCAVYDAPAVYGRAPNLVLSAAPAGLDKLALFHGGRP